MFDWTSPKKVVQICSSNYQFWKEKALKESDPIERKKAMEKAFFWLEAQSSMLVLWSLEKAFAGNEKVLEKINIARANISKRLLKYAENVLKELK